MEPRELPLDPTIPMSRAIAELETAAARAHTYGRFWMAYNDHAHGRRWFATETTLRRLAGEMRYQQWYMLNPNDVDTPTREEEATMREKAAEHGYNITILRTR